MKSITKIPVYMPFSFILMFKYEKDDVDQANKE